MILVAEVIKKIESALDAEGFDRYTFTRDYQPAISYAQEWLCSAISPLLGDNKFSEASFSDLLTTKIFVTNQFSRFNFNETLVGNKLWSIVSIFPDCTTYPNAVYSQPDKTISLYLPNESYLKSYKAAKRINSQETNHNRRNPFAFGNEIVTCEELKEYGFNSFVTYSGGYNNVATFKAEINILPDYKNKVLAMEYIKMPSDILSATGQIELPVSLTNMVIDKALNYISYKQGTSQLLQITNSDTKTLYSLLNS